MNIARMITPYKKNVMSNKQNKYIVIHYVGGTSSAKNNCIYYNRKDARDASAQYFVDDTGIYQLVDDKDAAWHCGATSYKHKTCRNTNSIGIEMCLKKDSNGKLYVTDKTIDIVGELVRELMSKYGIPKSNVIRHYDVTGKSCPNCNGLLNESTWVAFRNKICGSGSVPPAPSPSPSNQKVDIQYCVKTAKNGWLPFVKNLSDYAGYGKNPIIGLAIKVTAGSIKYRVHIKGGKWLPYVTGCNLNDHNNGYAGNNKTIDAIEVYYSTPSSIRPFKRVKYRVNGYAWQYDNETSNKQDGYAGAFGKDATKVEMIIE